VVLRAGPIVAGGSALARLEDGRVCLVALAAAGELVEAKVERVHADYVEAVTVRVLEPSADRVEARCEHFGVCGGCQLQHLSYPAQLEAKAAIVREQLARIGGFREAVVNATVGMARPWAYRNHVRFSTGRKYGDVGFVGRNGRSLLRIDRCPIADDAVNALLPELQGEGRGLHQVQVRRGKPGTLLLIAPAVPGLPAEAGQKTYTERLGGRDFVVSASSFFQVNSEQAEKLVGLVGDALPARGRLLVDAYAGVGTFATIFGGRFERVIAIEESASAVADARLNVADMPGVELHQGKVEDVLPGLEVEPDALLLDPARPGCAPPVLQAISERHPPVVVYVSCNPATFARDLKVLAAAGYRLGPVTPVDMFPQTAHIECVVRLELA
jgi:23S rRNA (uracil1939-C5)-methyltransferase